MRKENAFSHIYRARYHLHLLTLPERQKWHCLIFWPKTSRSIRRVPCRTDSSCNMAAYEEVHHMRFRFTDFRTRFTLFAWPRAMLEEFYFTFKPLVWHLGGGSFWSVALSRTSFLLALVVLVSWSLQDFNPSLMGPMFFCCFIFPKRPFVHRELVGRPAVRTGEVTSWPDLAEFLFSFAFPPQTTPKTANTWGNKVRCFAPCE